MPKSTSISCKKKSCAPPQVAPSAAVRSGSPVLATAALLFNLALAYFLKPIFAAVPKAALPANEAPPVGIANNPAKTFKGSAKTSIVISLTIPKRSLKPSSSVLSNSFFKYS